MSEQVLVQSDDESIPVVLLTDKPFQIYACGLTFMPLSFFLLVVHTYFDKSNDHNDMLCDFIQKEKHIFCCGEANNPNRNSIYIRIISFAITKNTFLSIGVSGKELWEHSPTEMSSRKIKGRSEEMMRRDEMSEDHAWEMFCLVSVSDQASVIHEGLPLHICFFFI